MPWCHCARVPRCHGATVPVCQGAMVPRCLCAPFAFPNNPTRRQRLVVRQGPGTTGLSPSPAPPSRGLGPSPPLRTLLQNTIRTTEPPDSKARLFPVRSPLLRQTCPRPNGFGRNLHSKTRWFMAFCNSHQVSHLATFFIDARAEISIPESRFHLQKKHRSPRRTPRTGREGQAIDSSFDNDPSAGSPMETLLRLLLPLNDKVQWTSRDVAGSEPPTLPRSQHFIGSFNRQIPLVRTSSELAVRCAGKVPEGTIPSPSPGRHAATRSHRGSSSSSPPTADGFGTGTPVPRRQSQSFYQSYESIFPTSLAYIVTSTRGCSPWRPDAVMSTTGRGRHSVLWIFKGRQERIGHHVTCGALPASGPYLRPSRFQGRQAVK
ncbi:hypothetical protein CQW23_31705 [Capsicum baccatum]|uniref:Protein TAR1 n=1 Tax=Capsicum baccatum TaxID=33114 RepID=A0A2G2V6W6_CAPBA|nr:hypothetical protein CQW23_31705 [Capsicum baccatum]